MGYSTALSYAEAVREGSIDLDAALSAHFTSNCFPPIPAVQIVPARTAIEAVNDGEPDRLIDLPEGVEHVQYGTQVPAWVFIDSLRLDAFLAPEAV